MENEYHCVECFEAEMELLQDVHIRQDMREIEKMIEEERQVRNEKFTESNY